MDDLEDVELEEVMDLLEEELITKAGLLLQRTAFCLTGAGPLQGSGASRACAEPSALASLRMSTAPIDAHSAWRFPPCVCVFVSASPRCCPVQR